MKWVLALSVVLLVLLLLKRRSQRSSQPAPRPAQRLPDSKLRSLKLLEGAVCIYEEGTSVLKGRFLQVEEHSGRLVFVVQTLRAEGLSDLPEERLNLEAPPASVDVSSQLVHARQTHWRLYFQKDLIEKVLELGRSRADMKAIKRVLLEHQMK